MLYASVYNEDKVSNTLYYAGPFLLSKQSQQTRFLFDGGYYIIQPPRPKSQPQFYYYAYDHLGSIRCAVSTTGIGSERGDYYPDGTLISDLSWPGSYKYNGKEFDNLYRLNWLDYGARQYMPDLAQFTSVDPLCEKYYHLSPYAYCANNPVNAIDSDGNLCIFINGWYLFNGGSSYWNTQNGSFSNMVLKHFKDSSRPYYYDGSLGGAVRTFISSDRFNPGEDNTNLSAYVRYKAGYNAGIFDAEEIISNLRRDGSGNVIEPIRIISHSMGGMYSKGFAQALVEYVEKNPKTTNGLIISEYDFAPYQPKSQSAVKGVDTYQYSHVHDIIAGSSPIKGAHYMPTSKATNKKHSLGDFTEYINSLQEGRYKFINGKIRKY